MSTMNVAIKTQITENLNDLPETSLQEVLDFVEFLRYRNPASEDPILDVAGMFSGTPLQSSEIDLVLYGELEGE